MIDGARIIRQLVLINGIPFEIKSIYGLTQDKPIVTGEASGEQIGEAS